MLSKYSISYLIICVLGTSLVGQNTEPQLYQLDSVLMYSTVRGDTAKVPKLTLHQVWHFKDDPDGGGFSIQEIDLRGFGRGPHVREARVNITGSSIENAPMADISRYTSKKPTVRLNRVDDLAGGEKVETSIWINRDGDSTQMEIDTFNSEGQLNVTWEYEGLHTERPAVRRRTYTYDGIRPVQEEQMRKRRNGSWRIVNRKTWTYDNRHRITEVVRVVISPFTGKTMNPDKMERWAYPNPLLAEKTILDPKYQGITDSFILRPKFKTVYHYDRPDGRVIREAFYYYDESNNQFKLGSVDTLAGPKQTEKEKLLQQLLANIPAKDYSERIYDPSSHRYEEEYASYSWTQLPRLKEMVLAEEMKFPFLAWMSRPPLRYEMYYITEQYPEGRLNSRTEFYYSPIK